ncbi:MAG: hypothetical protein J07AB43_01980 [Candidatus Nanosalina sp. J07AB43]|jgi:hypothetical protein|nr:MAG: hypothetical protein J07AB43_01980 [Candidatus Nanosalina sp. J07AB43]
MSEDSSGSDDKRQKSLYTDEELASWIEDASDFNDRSESYFIAKILREVKESADDDITHMNEYLELIGEQEDD